MCINQFTFLNYLVLFIPFLLSYYTLSYMDPFNVLVIVLTIYVPGTQTIQCLQCAWCDSDQYESEVYHSLIKAFMVP